MSPPEDRWLLLIHQLPARPAYLRVKVWRRLQGLCQQLVGRVLEYPEHALVIMQAFISEAVPEEARAAVDDFGQRTFQDLVALPHDVLLLASDGLTKHVKDERLREMVEKASSLEAACEQLIQAARDDGGDDNITCLLLRIEERPWYKQIFQRWWSGGPQWQNSI